MEDYKEMEVKAYFELLDAQEDAAYDKMIKATDRALASHSYLRYRKYDREDRIAIFTATCDYAYLRKQIAKEKKGSTKWHLTLQD